MKDVLLTTLRDCRTSTSQFRQAAHQLSALVAFDSAQFLSKQSGLVETPIASTQGVFMRQAPILIPILRAGLALLPAFLSLYPSASVGFIGIRREEETAAPQFYSSHLPSLKKEDDIFLLDPMVATGQSAGLAIALIEKAGGCLENIVLISFLAAPEGVAHLKSRYPMIRTHIVQVDQRLDSKSWIVPGLGDFGDRYFGT